VTAHIRSLTKYLSNLSASFQPLYGKVMGVLLPQCCFVCGAGAGDALLCRSCHARLPYWRRSHACPVCAQATPGGEICGQCLREPPAYDRVEALFEYAFPVDRMVQALKYRHRLALIRCFAQELAQWCATAEMARQAEVIVPVPMHAARLGARGFNQAAELARALKRTVKLPLLLDQIVKEQATPPQEGLSRRVRRKNVRGTFRCRRSFAGESVLIVDDVMTTGATLDSLADELKRHGARRVAALVLARTSLPH